MPLHLRCIFLLPALAQQNNWLWSADWQPLKFIRAPVPKMPVVILAYIGQSNLTDVMSLKTELRKLSWIIQVAQSNGVSPWKWPEAYVRDVTYKKDVTH